MAQNQNATESALEIDRLATQLAKDPQSKAFIPLADEYGKDGKVVLQSFSDFNVKDGKVLTARGKIIQDFGGANWKLEFLYASKGTREIGRAHV